MPRARTKGTLRPRKRGWAETVEFPRWIAAAGVVAIGLLLLLAGLSDASGRVAAPGAGSVLYVAAILGVATAVALFHRKRGFGKTA